MKKIFRNLIEYNIDECSYLNLKNFKQTNVDFIFRVPAQKEDIKEISKVWTQPFICIKKLVKIPYGESLEGQKLTGNGMILEGDLEVRIEYVGDMNTSLSHICEGWIPFSLYIVLDQEVNTNSFLVPTVVIEDVYVEKFDGKSIYINITFLGIVDIC